MITCPACGHRFEAPLRTTGKFSQNHAIHGFASQIAKSMDDGTGASSVIEEAAARAGLVHFMNKFGRFVFKHESLWTKEEATKVIKELKELADFVGCRLVEISE